MYINQGLGNSLIRLFFLALNFYDTIICEVCSLELVKFTKMKGQHVFYHLSSSSSVTSDRFSSKCKHMISFTVMKVDYVHQLLYFYLHIISLITENPCVSETVFNSSSLVGKHTGTTTNSPLLHLGNELTCMLFIQSCTVQKANQAKLAVVSIFKKSQSTIKRKRQ